MASSPPSSPPQIPHQPSPLIPLAVPPSALLPPPLELHSTVASPPWRLSFTQGILLGQASMVLLAVLFLKYVVFEDPETARMEKEERREERKRARRRARGEEGELDGEREKTRRGKGKGKGKASPDLAAQAAQATTSAALLSSLSYDLPTHPPESLDWLNVLLAQLLSSYRLLAATSNSGGARALVEEALNRKTGGGEGDGVVGIDWVEVEEVELGEAYPVLSRARVRPSGVGGEGVRVELDLDYSDRVSISVSTRVVMNFPRPRFAVLPISLSLTLERFSGTLTIELPSPTTPSSVSGEPPHAHPSLHLSLHPDFDLQLRTSSLLGSRAKLQDVPKIEQLLAARIRAAIQDRVVWPGRVEIALPGVKPSKHHHHHSHHHDSPPVTPPALSTDSDPLSPSPFPPTPSAGAANNLNTTPRASTSTLHSKPPLFPRSSTATTATTNTSSSSQRTPDTPSVDLSAPEGPSISLHPHIRRPSEASGRPVPPVRAGGGGGGGAPSPTESLPGYFPPASGGAGGRRGSGAAASATAATKRGIEALRSGQGPAGVRYRGAGAVGVGLAAGSRF